MKTSNKILLAFTILVFQAPVLLFMGFRRQIREGNYSLFQQGVGDQNLHGEELKNFRTVRIVGLADRPELLSCRIYADGQASYRYYKWHDSPSKDSVKVTYAQDTLVMTYVPGTDRLAPGKNFSFDLYLPSAASLDIQSAHVTLDTSFNMEQGDAHIRLRDQARFSVGSPREDHGPSGDRATPATPFPDSPAAILFRKLYLQSFDSHLTLGPGIHVGELNLQMNGGSGLAIDRLATVDTISGSISAHSIVHAGWDLINKLTTLSGN